MATIYLYNNTSDNRSLNKSITFLDEFNCDIMSGCSVANPTLIISNDHIVDYLHSNYCYIDLFDRYYYIDDFIMLENGVVQISCSVDVLFTYRDYIMSIQCLITRQEYKYNDMLEDSNVIMRVGTKTDKKRIGSIGTDISYILTVTGGSE